MGGRKPRAVGWQQRYEELVAYQKENWHTNVPNRYPSNPQSGTLVKNPHQAFKYGKLKQEQVVLLNAIGFQWEATSMGVSQPNKAIEVGGQPTE